jgi:hypothetical protein
MKLRLEDVLSAEQRLDLWAEMMTTAAMMQEYCDWWWRLDDSMRRANDLRHGGPESCQLTLPNISE